MRPHYTFKCEEHGEFIAKDPTLARCPLCHKPGKRVFVATVNTFHPSKGSRK